MKRGRKTTISTENISRELISHKEQIIQNNILIKSSNILWKQLISKYNWNITPKALWTRIFKYSPNYDKFFESESKQCKTIFIPVEHDNIVSDEQLSNSDQDECNDENTIRMLTIYVSAKSWNEIQRDDGLKNKLKPGVWTNVISKIIYDTHSINCAWSFKSHEVTTSETSDYLFVFSATCTDSECGVRITGEVLRHKNLPNPSEHGVNITLNIDGNYRKQHIKKRRFGGKRRQEVSNYLLETKTTSTRFRKDEAKLLCKNIFDPESPLLPRLETIRKAKSEKNCKGRHDSQEIISLNIMQNCNPWQNIIRNLSFQPFVIHYWTPDQLRVYNSFVKKERAAKICIDATGDVVKKISRPSNLSKYIFIYLVVIKLPNENEGQISVCQMLSESHNTNTICFWLLEWRRNGALLPKEVVTDFSMALINSVCMSFAGCAEGSSTYIQRCMEVLIKSPGCKLPSCYVRVDVAHLLKFVTTWKSLNDIHVRRRVKEFYVRAIGQLVMATDLNESKFLIKNIFVVMLSEYEGEINGIDTHCEKAKQFFITRFANGVEQSIVEGAMDYQPTEYSLEKEYADNQEDDYPHEIKKWINNIVIDAKNLVEIDGSRDNLMYLPALMMPFKILCYKLPLWTSIMSKSFEYGHLTASSASVESHINEIKHYSGIQSNIRVDDFIKYHTSYLEGSMKLASGLRYFQNPLGIDDIEGTMPKNVRSEDEISISTDISCFVDDLNKYENWGGKVDSNKKTKKSKKDQLTQTLIPDNDSSLNSHTSNLKQKSSKICEDIQDSCNESDLLILDSFQIDDDDLIFNISPDPIIDDIYQKTNVDLPMNNNITIDNIIQEQLLSQATDNMCKPIENPSALPQLPSRKKRSKYLNPDSEWLTIPLDQISSPSKLGLLPNGGIIISGRGSQRQENSDTYNLSNTCGFDSIIQLMAVAFCDSSKLREQILEINNNPGIELAIDISRTNSINKNLLNKRFDILKNIFDTTEMPNNMKRINCDCNIVEILKDLSIFSLKEIRRCSNISCQKQYPTITFPSLLFNFKDEKISDLQTLMDKYDQFEAKEKHCTDENCKGNITRKKIYNDMVFIAISCENESPIPNEIMSCQLGDIPNFIRIGEKALYLRGTIGYYPPLSNTRAIGHYVGFAKRSSIFWEVHDDMNKKIKPVRSSKQVMIALLLYTE